MEEIVEDIEESKAEVEKLSKDLGLPTEHVIV